MKEEHSPIWNKDKSIQMSGETAFNAEIEREHKNMEAGFPIDNIDDSIEGAKTDSNYPHIESYTNTIHSNNKLSRDDNERHNGNYKSQDSKSNKCNC